MTVESNPIFKLDAPTKNYIVLQALSTGKITPLTLLDKSEAKYKMEFAISPGVISDTPFSLCTSHIGFRCSKASASTLVLSMEFPIPVPTATRDQIFCMADAWKFLQPGKTALHLIPSKRNLQATFLVKPSTACLLAV